MIKNVPVILIEDVDSDNNQLGSAVLEAWGEYLFVRMLYVEPYQRRQRIATRLIEHAKTLVSEGSGLALRPESWADKPMRLTQLREWYRRLGFIPCKNHKGLFVWVK